MTGTKDTTPIGEQTVESRLAVFEALPPGNKYEVVLDNAERHAGGAVLVAVRVSGSRVRLEVEDAGPGVPEPLREQIFERFARGVMAGSRGDDTGSGLGLALVREHVLRLGGRVWVEDRAPRGSRFVVELKEF